ncbi:MAG: hypothetical protein COC24_002150 [Alphaproteobacteria bacterium]|nr:hypothetical protein [Alphaproteobacteria bacterium]
MFLSKRDILRFFVEFEKAIYLEAAPQVMDREIKDVTGLLKILEGYSGTELKFHDIDLSKDFEIPEGVSLDTTPADIASYILNFGNHAEIYINSMENGRKKRVVNKCNTRFLIVKEALHVILRDEFETRKEKNPNYDGHPDANSPELICTAIEDIVFLPVSIFDLDNEDYPPALRIENYAELLAMMLLYPMNLIAIDRQYLLSEAGVDDYRTETAQLASTLDYAERYKVPQRYVNLIFRWSGFEEFYSLYCQARDGYLR